VFLLKKLISFYLAPLPLCVGLLVIGLVFCLSVRRERLGRRIVLAAAVLLFLFSNRFVSMRLLGPLEAQYPAVPEVPAGARIPDSIAACRVVAVLGGGHKEMPDISATSQLSSSALARIVEATRILRMLPNARLVVSGPGEPGHPSHASVLAAAAKSLGVDAARITLIDSARDTEDESFAFARLLGGERTALITSAWHMPRAAHLFRKAGVNFVCCPADYIAKDDSHFYWSDFAFDTESLQRSTLAVHELIGLLWLRLRGA
jgi:uncharacterized SAM-binding protein YcdF (DUF218 family)